MIDYSYRTLRKRKIILLGSYGVGKSSLIRRYIHNSFDNNYHTTIGVNVQTKMVVSGNFPYSLVIWDIAGGQEKYSVPYGYLLMSAGALYVYDVTRPASYENMEEEIKALSSKIKNAPILVIGNKIDLLSKDELVEHKNLMGELTHVYTSAKESLNVDSAFVSLVEAIVHVES